MAKNGIFRKFVLGAAIVYAANWILGVVPLSIPTYLALPLAGGLSILAVEFVAEKTGFYII